MIYDISLKITYDYANSAAFGRHILCLAPAHQPPDQSLLSHVYSVEPRPAEWLERVDFFGNAVVELAFDAPMSRTVFAVKARVERLAAPACEALMDLSPDLAGLVHEIDLIRDLGPQTPHHYRAPSARAGFDAKISAWAQRFAAPKATVFQIAERICAALHAEMTFDSDATEVDTPHSAAFAMRRGVCQDFTHIAIAALRSLGIPAGYVSGFLRTLPPAGKPRLEGADAMHAWVRVWCGRHMGWVEFDPTNAMLAGSDHIVIARGRDYGDVAPVRGALRMYGAQSTTQRVDVVAV